MLKKSSLSSYSTLLVWYNSWIMNHEQQVVVFFKEYLHFINIIIITKQDHMVCQLPNLDVNWTTRLLINCYKQFTKLHLDFRLHHIWPHTITVPFFLFFFLKMIILTADLLQPQRVLYMNLSYGYKPNQTKNSCMKIFLT